jgi:uncharacterized protein YycO
MNILKKIDTLKYGMYGQDVRDLQKNLKILGYANFMCTGFFGTRTYKAVTEFQRDCNLTITGDVDSITMAYIKIKLSEKRCDDIYLTAYSNLEKDVTPNDEVPDEVDCADTVSTILKMAGYPIGNIVSTTEMYKYLLDKPAEWELVSIPSRGCVIISPTGYGNGKMIHGHVGIMGEDGKIMSNNSYNGLLQTGYNVDTWKIRYVDKGGFPIFFFKRK